MKNDLLLQRITKLTQVIYFIFGETKKQFLIRSPIFLWRLNPMLLKKTSSCWNVEWGEESNPGRSLFSSTYLFSLYYELGSSVCFKLLCSVLFFWLGSPLMMWVLSNLTTLLFSYLFFIPIFAGVKAASFSQISVLNLCTYLFSNLVKKCWYFLILFYLFYHLCGLLLLSTLSCWCSFQMKMSKDYMSFLPSPCLSF